MAGIGLIRLQKELKMLAEEPPPGVCCWPAGSGDCLTHLQAQIQGPEHTPYEHGTFLLDLQIPDRYPFEPPKVRFVTPIYHPNIDSGGRICLDTLKMRPAGSWAPSMNVPTLLTTIRLLMAHPNGDDGLMPDITELFLKDPSRFADVARTHVDQHARQNLSLSTSTPTTSASSATKTTVSEGKTTADSSAVSVEGDTRPAAGAPSSDRGRGSSSGRHEKRPTRGRDGEDTVSGSPVLDDAPDRGLSRTLSQTGSPGKLEMETRKDNEGGNDGVVGDGDVPPATAEQDTQSEEKQNHYSDVKTGSSIGRSHDTGGNNNVGTAGGGTRGDTGGDEGDGEGGSSDDGAWSDSDDENDDDDDGGGGGGGGGDNIESNAKRTRIE